MKRPKNGYTMRQYAYASHKLAPKKVRTKKEAALLAGYPPSTASTVSSHIEKTEGYANAVAALASETGNVALKVLHTLKYRDLTHESTSTLLEAVTVLASAWDRFTPKPSKDDDEGAGSKGNPLRAIFVETIKPRDAESAPKIEEVKEPNPLD